MCFGPWLLTGNWSNSRSKHKPDALAGLLKVCCNDKGLHTQLCFWSYSNTALFPLQRFVCVPFPLPVLIDGVNLWIRSPVQFLYSMQTPGGLTTDQTDHKLDRGETGRRRESHLVMIVRPQSWAGTREWLGTWRGGVWAIPWWTSVPGDFYTFKTDLQQETAGTGCGEVLCEPLPCSLHLNHLCITPATLIGQMRMRM